MRDGTKPEQAKAPMYLLRSLKTCPLSSVPEAAHWLHTFATESIKKKNWEALERKWCDRLLLPPVDGPASSLRFDDILFFPYFTLIRPLQTSRDGRTTCKKHRLRDQGTFFP